MNVAYRIGLLGCLLFFFCLAEASAFWGSDYLVKINEQEFSKDDYRHWWAEWQEPGMAVHESVDEFVDFVLLAQEAKDMQLDENPAYQKKVRVFLKVRSLMQLKAEEVDAHKTIPEHEELWQAYKDEYTPLLDLRMIAVQEEEQAQVIRQFFEQGVAFEQLAEAAGLGEIAEQAEATGMMRYTRIPEPLRDHVVALQEGEVGGPFLYGHSWYFVKVLKRDDGNTEDFEKLKQKLISTNLKKQEDEYTADLLKRLREEYKVVVDQELIDRIGPEGPSAEDDDKIVISFEGLEVPAGFFYDAVQKAQSTRGQAMRNAESFATSKARIVNDILAQNLTEQEALARHYEEAEPLKNVYGFYTRYRLVKELENTLILPKVKVTDEDVRNYYEENLDEYAQNDVIEIAAVSTNEKVLAEKISAQLKQGEEFFQAMRPIAPLGVRSEKKELGQLAPEIAAAVKELATGQTATVVIDKDTHFIKVIRSAERKVMPFEKISKVIRETLEQDGFKETRAGMVKQLRDLSSIKVNKSAWKSLRKELLEEGR